jgi:mevalonate kinase
MVKAVSPGKLILSGEHSVLFGGSAITIAVDKYATTTVLPNISKSISFNLINLRHRDSFTIQTLIDVKKRLADKYHQFQAGDCGIKEVLQTPFALAQFTFMTLLEHFNTKIIKGLNISTESDIPIGCGMGSSAAMILSALKALAAYFKIELKPERYLYLGRKIENLQHGFSSGIDLCASLFGGCTYHQTASSHTTLNTNALNQQSLSMFMVNTGAPYVSTGESVEYVRQHFAKDQQLWQEFADVTTSIKQNLQTNNSTAIIDLIRYNHELLTKIHIVPQKIQNFITELETQHAAAKICGSGSISGSNAGIVLVFAESAQQINKICTKYNFTVSHVNLTNRGSHLV